MAVNIGPKIGIDGEKQYRDQINKMIQQGKTLDSEMKKVTASFNAETTAEEKNAKTKEVLEKQIANQKDRIALLNQMLQKAKEQYGEDATQTLKWEQALNEAEATLSGMENELNQTTEGTEEQGEAAEESEKKTVGWGDALRVAVAQEIVKGVKALASAMVEVAKAAAEAYKESAQWADDLMTLSTQSGISTEQLQKMQYMAKLVDTDVETVTGSMQKLVKNMGNAKDGTGSAAEAFASLGVSITDANGNLRDSETVFYEAIDALGKIDNETERDTTAMALFGKGAQELNPLIAAGADTLAAYGQEAEDTGYILSDDMVGALQESQDSFDRLGNSMDAIKRTGSAALAPIVNSVLDELVPGVQDATKAFAEFANGQITVAEFADRAASMIGGFLDYLLDALPDIVDAGVEIVVSLAEGIAQKLPDLANKAGQIIETLIGGLVKLLPMITQAIAKVLPVLVRTIGNLLADNIGIIIDAIVQTIVTIAQELPALIDAIIEVLPKLIENICDALITNIPILLQAIITLVMEIVNRLPEIIEMICDIIPTLIETIIDVVINNLPIIIAGIFKIIAGIIAKIPQIIVTLVKGVAKIMASLIGKLIEYGTKWAEAGAKLVQKMWDGIKEWWKNLIANVKEKITNLKDKFKSWIEGFKNIGSNIVKGIWNGIASGWNWLKEKVKTFVNNIIKTAKNILGIHSPSKVFANEIGKMIPEGIAVGIKADTKDLYRQAQASLGGLVDATLGSGMQTTNMGGVNITVYGAQGQDVNALADVVMNKMYRQVNARKAVWA